jgi:hypothetical protein
MIMLETCRNFAIKEHAPHMSSIAISVVYSGRNSAQRPCRLDNPTVIT